MKIRKHFRTDTAIVNYIIADLNHNKINKEAYLDRCVAQRISKINEQYDRKLDKIITFIILKCDFDNLPIQTITRLTLSLTKVMNVINKGFLSMIGDK